ncbi:hypothetical protein B0H14DRAFT_2638144 [Mycena olivaceomarginata]|nr:hypothetical protein B0H14DRAFT_2638144 [Mycena olivaceomarginata]
MFFGTCSVSMAKLVGLASWPAIYNPTIYFEVSDCDAIPHVEPIELQVDGGRRRTRLHHRCTDHGDPSLLHLILPPPRSNLHNRRQIVAAAQSYSHPRAYVRYPAPAFPLIPHSVYRIAPKNKERFRARQSASFLSISPLHELRMSPEHACDPTRLEPVLGDETRNVSLR